MTVWPVCVRPIDEMYSTDWPCQQTAIDTDDDDSSE